MLALVRSPANVCWHINYNGIFIKACSGTKSQANDEMRELKRKYGV